MISLIRTFSVTGQKLPAVRLWDINRRLKRNDLPHGLALSQPVEAQVDILKREMSAHQFVYWQPPQLVQGYELRQVAHGHAGANVAPLDCAFLCHNVDERQCVRL